MIWERLSVENGLFRGGDSDEYIARMCTGVQHQEVGGELRRDGIEGGFRAKRQQLFRRADREWGGRRSRPLRRQWDGIALTGRAHGVQLGCAEMFAGDRMAGGAPVSLATGCFRCT